MTSVCTMQRHVQRDRIFWWIAFLTAMGALVGMYMGMR